jgi:DNA mismatch repair protein MutL
MSIKVLDPRVVARIAAGEVVERPASVVKELVENSLDAGASQISVEVAGGGISLIRITDNGGGIPAADVEMPFIRHATSKISCLEDLESINSLGFRGEALPSIAAVAEVELQTCAAGEKAGTALRLRDGSVVHREESGRAPGTTLSVINLFRSIPARLKFLKLPATENSHIAGVVTQYALAYPEVRFTLSIDGRVTLRTPGRGIPMESVIAVYGPDVAAGMIKVAATQTSPRVTGLAGAPTIARARRDHLSFFVNRRWVNSRLLTRAVEQAYRGLLTTDRQPIAIMNIALPPDDVDVNIHPAKSEVKFRDEQHIFGAVQRAVRQALVEHLSVPAIGVAEPPVLPWPDEVKPSPRAAQPAPSPVTATPPTQASTPLLSLPVLRVIGQLAESYIVAEGPEGLYLIDQHASHERILFEQITQRYTGKDIEVQGLLEPVTLELSPRQDELLRARCAGLAEFGFHIEPFGSRTFLVRAVPALLHDKDWAGMIRELLDSLGEVDREGWIEAVTRTMACHSAIRAGQTLTDTQMRELVRQLERAGNPHTCPHGRPTMIHLGLNRLKSDFRRT